MKPEVFLCDLDGTLCNVNHRRHWVVTKPKNWKSWNAGISQDTPNEAVLKVIQCIVPHHSLFFVSGRSEEYRRVTEEWLEKYNVGYDGLFMRKEKDNRKDSIVKSEIADQIEKDYRIIGVFDDRKSVIDDCWIKRDVFVFDVGQGKGNF